MLGDIVIADIERDKLHREIQRTQGKLTSRYELDPVGRLKKQIAQLTALTEAKGKAKAAAGQTAVKRSYGYDRTGNLTHSTDQRSGTTHFEYDKLGRITQAGDELFAFDPAHNIIDSHERKVQNNRITGYGGVKFFYDEFGNTIHKEHPDGTTQNLYYDVFHQLVKTETFTPNQQTGIWNKETWVFDYDALGRRIRKGRLKESGGVSDGLEEVTEFIWSGSRLLQEVYAGGRYTYIYAGPNSYEPLAQIHNHTNAEGETKQEINYFHCDQIGIPREMTDREGSLIWFGEYDAWGKLTKETNITGTAHQPFRLQNQYCDRETKLHYNFFRYYDPDAGRFVNQDPIKLEGGNNLYQFAFNTTGYTDTLGLFDLPSLPRANEDNFAGYLWNRTLDGEVRDNIIDYGAGLLDNTTMNITRKARDLTGVQLNINPESQAYEIGDTVGTIIGYIAPAKAFANGAKKQTAKCVWKCDMKKPTKTVKKTQKKRLQNYKKQGQKEMRDAVVNKSVEEGFSKILDLLMGY